MTAIQKILDRAAEILTAAPTTWIRGVEARDSKGEATHAADPNACQFCAQGAIQKAVFESGCSDKVSVYLAAIAEAHTRVPISSIALANRQLWQYNDRKAKTVDDVVRVLRGTPQGGFAE